MKEDEEEGFEFVIVLFIGSLAVLCAAAWLVWEHLMRTGGFHDFRAFHRYPLAPFIDRIY